MTIRVGQRGTYVERIAKNNLSNPFLQLNQHGVENIQRIPEHQNFKLKDSCLVETKNGLKYGKILYIVNVINQCKLYDETIFLLNNYNETLWRNVFFKCNSLRVVGDYPLEKNSILISGSVGSYGCFDGFDFVDVDNHIILSRKVPQEDKLGEMHYDVILPNFAQDIDVSKISRKKHTARMKFLDDIEISELKAHGINITKAEHLEVDDGNLI